MLLATIALKKLFAFASCENIVTVSISLIFFARECEILEIRMVICEEALWVGCDFQQSSLQN